MKRFNPHGWYDYRITNGKMVSTVNSSWKREEVLEVRNGNFFVAYKYTNYFNCVNCNETIREKVEYTSEKTFDAEDFEGAEKYYNKLMYPMDFIPLDIY